MPEEINTPEVSTLEETADVTEAPDIDGQADVAETEETEQAEDGTDKAEQPKNYKELQAEFTRKSQEYADFKKQYEKQQEELNTFRQYYSQQQIQQQQQKQQPEQKSAKDFAEMSEMEKFNYLVDQRIDDSVKPYIEKITSLESYISNMQMENANRMWSEFVQQHPDAVNYTDQLTQLITNHNMPLDKAYKLIKADIAPAEVKQEVLKEIQVKKDAAKLQMPVTKTPATSTEIPDNFEDAYERAMRKVSGK